MAKLSARGRTEVVRLSKAGPVCYAHYRDESYDWGTAAVHCSQPAGHAGEHSGDTQTTWQRVEKVLMSDGKILSKLTVQFAPGKHSAGYRHAYGWKQVATIKPGVSAEQFTAHYTGRGWAVQS